MPRSRSCRARADTPEAQSCRTVCTVARASRSVCHDDGEWHERFDAAVREEAAARTQEPMAELAGPRS
jgi:hypothetical protein